MPVGVAVTKMNFKGASSVVQVLCETKLNHWFSTFPGRKVHMITRNHTSPRVCLAQSALRFGKLCVLLRLFFRNSREKLVIS